MKLTDKIGRENIIDKLCKLIKQLNPNQNISICLDGAWGSGKTYTLNLLEEKIEKNENYFIIRYDAWENTFYSDPLIAILACIIDGVNEKINFLDNKHQKKLAKKVAKTTIDIAARLSNKIAKLKEIVAKIIDKVKELNVANENILLEKYKSYKDLLNETKNILNQITKTDKGRKQKIVIIVDEIDRCLPEEQLKILERMHHLLDINNCAVIVSINQCSIATTVKTIYGINGYEYLKKFFTATFKLEKSSNLYLNSLFNDYVIVLKKYVNKTEELCKSIDIVYKCLINSKIIDNVDNRELTRYFEAIIEISNDIGWDKLTPYNIFFIFLGLYFRRFISQNFLNLKNITENQNKVEKVNSVPINNYKDESPYFDYIYLFCNLDFFFDNDETYNIFKEEFTIARGLSLAFNEMVYFSQGMQFFGNEYRQFCGLPKVNSDKCKQIADLIMLYAGENNIIN